MDPHRIKNKRGISRVFESVIAIVLVVFSLTFYLNFNPFTTSQTKDTSTNSASLIQSLNIEDVMLRILTENNSSWASDINQFLTASVPPGTYYLMNIYKVTDDATEKMNAQPICNIDEESMAKLPDTSTSKYILSPSLASSMGAFITNKLDIILALDTSGSMADENKLVYAKQAAMDFVDTIEAQSVGQNQTVQIGVIRYSYNAITMHELSFNYASIRQAINNIQSPVGATNIDEALTLSDQKLVSSPRKSQGAKSIIVFLTDGCPTAWTGPSAPSPAVRYSGSTYYYYGNCADVQGFQPRDQAKESADITKSHGIEIFTLGLGLEFDPSILKYIASSPVNTHFYH